MHRAPATVIGNALSVLAAGLLLVAATVPRPLSALPDDREQPIYIQSDRAERDERKGTTVYTGDVEIDQGSLHISAERVTVHDADEQVQNILATGSPAKMRQKPAQDEEPVYARAKTITYDVSREVLTLEDEASVTQPGGTLVTGARIDYFVREGRVKATGGNSSAGETRVNVVIQPRKNARNGEGTGPAAGDAPAGDAPREPDPAAAAPGTESGSIGSQTDGPS